MRFLSPNQQCQSTEGKTAIIVLLYLFFTSAKEVFFHFACSFVCTITPKAIQPIITKFGGYVADDDDDDDVDDDGSGYRAPCDILLKVRRI